MLGINIYPAHYLQTGTNSAKIALAEGLVLAHGQVTDHYH